LAVQARLLLQVLELLCATIGSSMVLATLVRVADTRTVIRDSQAVAAATQSITARHRLMYLDAVLFAKIGKSMVRAISAMVAATRRVTLFAGAAAVEAVEWPGLLRLFCLKRHTVAALRLFVTPGSCEDHANSEMNAGSRLATDESAQGEACCCIIAAPSSSLCALNESRRQMTPGSPLGDFGQKVACRRTVCNR